MTHAPRSAALLRSRRALLGALGALLALTACSSSSKQDVIPIIGKPRTRRAIWITRFDYRTEDDVVRVVQDCAEAGFDTLLFQVRGNATAFYRSSFEPWAAELGGADPGFDPLEVALREARARKLALHAWVNVVPAWWGTELPADPHDGPKQVVNAHPEWLWYDQQGERQPYSDRFYVSLNPCLPEVRQYLVDVLRDLVARYRLDGLHLDYLRFPNEPPGTPAPGVDYPRDERTLKLFLGDTGKTPDEDPAAWVLWRAERVTDLLREIRRMAERTRPAMELSAAVGPEPELSLSAHYQDTRTWLRERLLDRVYPMNYAAEMDRYEERVRLWEELAPSDQVVMGLRVDLAAPRVHVDQMERARKEFHGFALFAYQALFDSTNEVLVEQDTRSRIERSERRKPILAYVHEIAEGQ
jgi:uncharacterized lipoprotein YddW (UPF0748 family)